MGRIFLDKGEEGEGRKGSTCFPLVKSLMKSNRNPKGSEKRKFQKGGGVDDFGIQRVCR